MQIASKIVVSSIEEVRKELRMKATLQLKRGIYQVVITYYEEGQRCMKWVSTGLPQRGNKRRAEKMMQKILEDFEAERINAKLATQRSPQMPFVSLLEDWITSEKHNLHPHSWEGDRRLLNAHIIPYFKPLGLSVSQVRAGHILEYYTEKLTKGRLTPPYGGLKRTTVKKHATVFNRAFRYAILHEMVERNPARDVPIPKINVEPPEKGYLTASEYHRFIAYVKEDELADLIQLTVLFGLRRGEALGLRWKAIDFKRGLLSIEHTVVQMKTLRKQDSVKSTASLAEFPLLKEAKELLMTRKEKQQEDATFFGWEVTEDSYIFTWPDGELYKPAFVTRRLNTLGKEFGIKNFTFHSLRHTTASVLHEKGWRLKDTQTWMRHRSATTTADIYTHLSENQILELGDKVQKALSASPKES